MSKKVFEATTCGIDKEKRKYGTIWQKHRDVRAIFLKNGLLDVVIGLCLIDRSDHQGPLQSKINS